MTIPAILANAVSTDWVTLLVQGGVAGVVLAWFMFRTEGRLKAIETSNDRIARSVLLLVLSLRDVNTSAKSEAQKVLKEIDDNQARNDGGK